MKKIIWSRRLVVKGFFVALTWPLAGIGYLLGRHCATAPLIFAGVFVLGAEYAYDVNTYASEWIGGRALTPVRAFRQPA